MSYTILNVAYPFAPVRPDTPGGAEQILLTLDNALIQNGHRSIVAACQYSLCRGTLIQTLVPSGTVDDTIRAKVWALHQNTIRQAMLRWKIDLIHMHGIDFLSYLPPSEVPILVTLHMPIEWYPPAVFALERRNVYFNCVSLNQQKSCPPKAKLLPFIENGVKTGHPSASRKKDFALCLGRICPEKGYHIALQAAREAGINLIIAGMVFGYEEHERYFLTTLAPLLDGKKYRFIGPVTPRRKRALLSAARCLLVPSLVAETSSLVAMEAFACGTPVIAFPSGALASIVEQGKTGFIVRNASEMARAIKRAGEIDALTCRETAQKRFSADAMIRRYLDLYATLIEGTATCVSR